MLETYVLNMINLFCFDESSCYMELQHLPFQCGCNDNETLASYTKGHYDFFDVEQIEEFVAFKGAYEISSLLEDIDDAPYKSESPSILKYCFENYNADAYITNYIERISPQRKRLMFCRILLKKKLLKLEAP